MDVSAYEDGVILKTDSYKLTQWAQLPKGTTRISSYLESRIGGKFPSTIFFGLQPYLRMLEGDQINRRSIDIAREFSMDHFGKEYFNYEGWKLLLKDHEGRLPIKIRAVDEGMRIPVGNALAVNDNLDPKHAWLTNYVESLWMKVWYPTTIATNSNYCGKNLEKWWNKNSDDPNYLKFALHDFGYRGVSCEEQAKIGGMAHLLNFLGTDNIQGIISANKFYNQTDVFQMLGFSVPASEHSTATPWGKGEGELDYIRHMLETYPTGTVSMVADSFNTYEFIEKLATHFKGAIINRDGRVVARPDSGDPCEVNVKIAKIAWEHFGGRINSKGYKVLPDVLRNIQGDAVDYEMTDTLPMVLDSHGFAVENLYFGSGGGLLQKFDRDTLRFAIKCSYSERNGQSVNVQKDPFTSNGTKKSKAGELKTIYDENGNITTASSLNYSKTEFEKLEDLMKPVFENGKILKTFEFSDIRKRVGMLS